MMSDFLSTSRHPEFISGYHRANIILKQVQHDEAGDEFMCALTRAVRPEPVEGQGGMVHASTSSARTAKVLDQKKLTGLVEGQVMRSYCVSLGEILNQVQHDRSERS